MDERRSGNMLNLRLITQSPGHSQRYRTGQHVAADCFDDLKHDRGVGLIQDASALTGTWGLVCANDIEAFKNGQRINDCSTRHPQGFHQLAALHRTALTQQVDDVSAQSGRHSLKQRQLACAERRGL